MKKMCNIIVLALLCANVSAQTANSIKGNWQGSIAASGVELGIIFKIDTKENKLNVKMDVPMQGAKDIPADNASFVNDTLRITYKALQASYEGVLKKNEKLIEGKWLQGGQSFPLKLAPQTVGSTGFNRPQEPKRPFPYVEEEITFVNKEDNITLAGTLTLPSAKGSFPAVVLISGSGAHNRDEEVLGHKPFLVLADHLTRNGIAVLRFDDRGAGKSGGDFRSSTSADFKKDVAAAVNYLRSRKEIDKKKIGLAGHSEGGMIAPMLAAEDKDIAFIVLLAGPGVKGDELLLMQTKALLNGEGADHEKAAEFNRQVYKIAVMEPIDTAQAQLKRYIRMAANDDPALAGQVDVMVSPWMRYFLKYDPAVAFSKVKCPVLAINGDKDLQVPAKENLHAIEAALKSGGNDRCTARTIAGVNHLFQSCTKGTPDEYAAIEETISPAVLKMIEEWVKEITLVK